MTGEVLQLTSPQEYFRVKVKEAFNRLNLSFNDEIEFYIVNLLCDFIDPSKINDALGECDPMDTPLVFLLQKAQESEPEFQIGLFKLLGDTSLYVAGYFQDYFNRKTFDINYYIMMGSHAYGQAGKLLHEKHEENTSQIFFELSNSFLQLVDVVAEVSQRPDNANSKDILILYDRWNRTNSERLRKILNDLGIDPVPVPLKLAQ